MRNYSVYTVFFFTFLLLFSCKKTKLITYEGENALYFAIPSTDSLRVDFSLLHDSVRESILKIPVGLLGRQIETATSYEIVIDDQLTTAIKGSDFEMPEQFSFPANKSRDTLSVKVTRTERLAKKEYVIGLELKSNSQFNNARLDPTSKKDQSPRVKIYITDLLAAPKEWATTPDRFGTEYYLGRFSKKKVLLIAEITKRSLNSVYRTIDTYRTYFSRQLYDYLVQQRKAGTPVLEEDGTLMKVGPYLEK
ncbi:DUF4843 domain-containing protein [Pedobacter endophyticus]|uniref:DUF4843 domain-containing protein n=1 Tax=Pedobacter endophyticus TaxID=2789740 RepID=A0A7S9L3A9_9SPHI|nr:DUF4843 domain-containing protein [Pedobacter endophyticus]QPH41479.1 DUF4843 domain-containing protein [Pedobacter endophyticus]